MPGTELINTLLIVGAAQGLFLAILLAARRTNSVANRLLAIAMLAFSLFIVMRVYYQDEWYLVFPHLIGVNRLLIYLFGPLLYLYTLAVSEGGNTFRKVWLLHLLPPVLLFLYRIQFFLADGTTKISFLRTLMAEGPSTQEWIIEQLQYVIGIVYCTLTIVHLRRHRLRLLETHSWVERINLMWLRNLNIGIVTTWLLATFLQLLVISGIISPGIESTITALAVAALVYAIGYMGLRQPEIFHSRTGREAPAAAPGMAMPNDASGPALDVRAVRFGDAPGAEPGEGTGYGKSGLSDLQAEAYLKRLLRLMDEKKPYQNSYLTLQELADDLSISAHHLSRVINTKLGKNFYDFVNEYRVEEVKRRLLDPKFSNLKILAIGMDAGFNTKSTFNAFFKKHTGLTPSDYRAQHPAAA
jgi:AraC-like DNA-binding protein